MLQQDEPKDYVVATGRTTSVGEFCELAFNCADLNWEDYVDTDPAFLRPAEVELLCGDASKARSELGWQPRVDLEELVEIMVRSDLARYSL
jgi:GDPmannose 4,6-dehydratase